MELFLVSETEHDVENLIQHFNKQVTVLRSHPRFDELSLILTKFYQTVLAKYYEEKLAGRQFNSSDEKMLVNEILDVMNTINFIAKR